MINNINYLHHDSDIQSNLDRSAIFLLEPKCLRTFTPSFPVISKSAGAFHWTPEGKRLADFTSGVLVANLGHNSIAWTQRFFSHMNWNHNSTILGQIPFTSFPSSSDSKFFKAVPMTAYNATTPVEIQASKMLLNLCSEKKGGVRLEKVLWAASGSEAVIKALWAALSKTKERNLIFATRHGFHGKKGLAGAVSGCETDRERDSRVHFISFPKKECMDISNRHDHFNPLPYRIELDALWEKHRGQISALITEPYLGGGGSFHPHSAYLLELQSFCRDHGVIFILDEVQSNFGRTSQLFAFEHYGLEPDLVVLGKGLGNGMPVAAVVGRADLLDAMEFGEGSDTWSANPLASAAVLATLEEFKNHDYLGPIPLVSSIIENGLRQLQLNLPYIAHIRGELGGMVWGLEMRECLGKTATEWANAFILACYIGEGNEGIHLLGPLAQKVIRISPPLILTKAEASFCMEQMLRIGISIISKAT